MDYVKFYNENQELFDNLNKVIMDQEFAPVKEVYFDLCTLKDLRMGLLLSKCNESEVKYIVENVNEYNKRPNRSFLWGLPELKFTEQELTREYYSPANWEKMFNRAPDTDLSVILEGFFKLFIAQNTRAEYKDTIILNINTFPIKECKLLDIYKAMLSKYLPGGPIVKFFCTNPSDLSSGFWKKQSTVVLDNIEHLTVKDSGLYNTFFVEQAMLSTKIFAPYQVTDERYAKWKTQYRELPSLKELFAPTEATLQAISQFQFIPCNIPV